MNKLTSTSGSAGSRNAVLSGISTESVQTRLAGATATPGGVGGMGGMGAPMAAARGANGHQAEASTEAVLTYRGKSDSLRQPADSNQRDLFT